ncbi:hypothetical protein OIU79_005103 [Salix purpurea]|uniref:Uncharacterized protein n=1 Tax=Salix purpurea TaxID=77065 RepID=A0A9Q0UBT3_SALPP|nr:hypothetical protein OIU79_005103 [Salix purpurea]KAJ6727105.1 hypothetical protein OIU79_005103 [Salix purpurea]
MGILINIYGCFPSNWSVLKEICVTMWFSWIDIGMRLSGSKVAACGVVAFIFFLIHCLE